MRIPKQYRFFALIVIGAVIGVTAQTFGFPLEYLVAAGGVLYVAALISERSGKKTKAQAPDQAVMFRTPLYNPHAKLPGLVLEKDLIFKWPGPEAFARLANTGQTAIGPLNAEVSLAYSNFFGTPASGGNHFDGILLTPAPEIAGLEPGESLEVTIFGPDRTLSVAPQTLAPKKEKIVQQVATAGSVIDFLKQDKTGAFCIYLRLGTHMHSASLFASDLALFDPTYANAD